MFCDVVKEELNEQGKPVYQEWQDGTRFSWEYLQSGSRMRRDNPDGSWKIEGRDYAGRLTSMERSDGTWEKYEYDIDGNRTYFADQSGWWFRAEYDEYGDQTFFENADGERHVTPQASREADSLSVDALIRNATVNVKSRFNVPGSPGREVGGPLRDWGHSME